MLSLGAYTVLWNANQIRYPWKASLASSLALADRVFICDAQSTDGTWEELQEWASREPRLEIMRWHSLPKHHTDIAHICNGILENATLKSMGASCQIQGDEIVCEWTIDATRKFLDNMDPHAGLGAPYYRNFCPDFKTTWPFIYNRKAVLARTSTGVRWGTTVGGDACALVGFPCAELPLEIHHVGKVEIGRKKEALYKEYNFSLLYKEFGFPDKKVVEQLPKGFIDYRELFAGAEFSPYDGPHPVFLKEWIEEMEALEKASC